MMASDLPARWQFGDVVVDNALHRVVVSGVPRDLEPKAFRLLQFLIEHRDHVVSKEEILAAIWDDSVVSDNALSRAIAQIRKIIGDDSKHPSYLETVPKVGYRLIAEVEALPLAAASIGGEPGSTLPGTSFAAGGRRGLPMGAATEPSIAVMPFANLSADKENEYFADGLAEEILNSLARISELKVIARTSSFAFRGKQQGVAEVATALRVRYVLEGSVRRAGTQIRVTAQLIDAHDGRHLWSERYDREVTDVFAIQNDMGEAISTALRVRIAPPVRTVNLQAYQLLLKGRYYLLQLSQESLAKARACFEQARAVDPGSAAAHSAFAEYHHTLYVMGLAPAETQVPIVRAATEQALRIDPDHSEAHSLLAALANTVDYQWDTAEVLHQRACAVTPVSSIILYRLVIWHLLVLNRVDEAEEQLQTGLATDPLNMALQHGVAQCHFQARRYQQAVEHAQDMVALDASHANLLLLGAAQFRNGDLDAAIRSLTRVVELVPWWPMGIGWLAAVSHLAGNRARAEALGQSLPPGRHAATYHAAAGHVDEMFEGLEVAWRTRDAFLTHILTDGVFAPYFDDSRFKGLLARMNLAI
jgi:TolB-like protein/DNA-binding winged helix-turn-helix (wHTH) protein/Tfp pilus assembly protein PilF